MDTKDTFNDFFTTQLNAEQQQAVSQKKGPMLIIAGAGSGKTRVITARIVNLILNENVPAHAIIALTFTNKAALEMKERITTMLSSRAYKPFIGTFHSYCLHLLRTNAHLAPYEIFSILDSDDQQQMLQKLIKRFQVEKKITAKNLGYQISIKKNQGTNKQEYGISYSKYLFEELYQAYEQEKKVNKVIDFDDLLIEVNTMFTKHEQFKKQFQQIVRHILVDEYQDTNVVQHELLKNMSLKNKKFALDSLCVVGDEDQSIYSWRGATVANIMQFKNDFPDTTLLKIEQNYRSVQPILHIANHVIEHNTYRNPKNIWSEKKASDRARVLSCLSGYQEGEAFACCIKTMRKDTQSHSIAILYRAHYQSRVIEEALIRHSIPYKIIGGLQFYERKEIKDLLAYLRLIANPFDRVSFSRVINTPQRGLGKKFEEEFDECWQKEPLCSFYDIAKRINITGKKATELQQFITLISSFNHEHKPSTCINEIVGATNYFMYLKESFDPQEAEAKIENIKELLRAVTYFEEQGITTVSALLQEIALMQEKMMNNKEAHNQIQLMTLHAAKGLEFDMVMLSGLEEGIFPSGHVLYDGDSIEEERRLFYVGITRAKEYILFSHARYRYTFGSMTDQRPSRFLHEVPEHLIQRADASHWENYHFATFFAEWLGTKKPKQAGVLTFGTAQKITQPTVSSQPHALREKQTVKHAKFGIGIIKTIEQKTDATYVNVQFKKGVKKIKADFLQSA